MRLGKSSQHNYDARLAKPTAFARVRFQGEKSLLPSNLVVAFSTNMPPERVAVFCRSVREVCSPQSTEIVIITEEPRELLEALRPLDVRFQWTSCDYRPTTAKLEKLLKRTLLHSCRLFARTPLDRRLAGGAAARVQYRLAESWCHPQIARWFNYHSVLLERPHVRRVLLSDVKDVILQADCFAGLDERRVLAFEQTETYGQCRWDTEWLRDGWGRSALEAMRGELPLNVGTILGGYEPTLRFVRRVAELFCRYPFRSVEQAAINWMLHREGDGAELERRRNIEGQVAILAGKAARAAVEARDGMIVRVADQAPCPIVHMWDRWEDLNDLVLRRYAAPQAAEGEPMVETPPESIFDEAAVAHDIPASPAAQPMPAEPAPAGTD